MAQLKLCPSESATHSASSETAALLLTSLARRKLCPSENEGDVRTDPGSREVQP